MKKIIIALLAITNMPWMFGAASEREQTYDLSKFIETVKEKSSLELDPARLGRYSLRGDRKIWTLPLDEKEPITQKPYRALITASLTQGKPYELTQVISLNPELPPFKVGQYIHEYTPEHEAHFLSTFVDSDAYNELLGTKEPTAIDRFGSNLEIEQVQVWRIPHILDQEDSIRPEAGLDRNDIGFGPGFIPFVSDNPKSIPSKDLYIALINKNIKVTQMPEDGSFPYLVDVLPLEQTAQGSHMTFRSILKDPKLRSEDTGMHTIVRALLWDKATKKARIDFFDEPTFKKMREEQLLPAYYKIQIFQISPENRNNAYLVREVFQPGYYNRGQFYLVDQDYTTEGSIQRPARQPNRIGYYTSPAGY